jgi:hypothetical protein
MYRHMRETIGSVILLIRFGVLITPKHIMIISGVEELGEKVYLGGYRPHLSISLFSSRMKCA